MGRNDLFQTVGKSEAILVVKRCRHCATRLASGWSAFMGVTLDVNSEA